MPPERTGTPPLPDPDEKTALDRLNQRLYSPQANVSFVPPPLPERLPPTASGAIPAAWTTPHKKASKNGGLSWTIIFLCVAALFCAASAGVSFYFLAQGGRSVSSDNITMTVAQGTPSITSGTAVPIIVTIKNNNPAAITNATITLTFPDGTRSADDITQPLVRYTNAIGTMQPGTTVTRTVEAVLLGNADQALSIPANFTYQTANSDAQFQKQQNYTFTITSSPLTITAQSVPSVASEQPFSIVLAIRSNATSALTNVAVEAQYPTGFVPAGSTTGSQSGFFTLGTLAPGDVKNLTIQGSLTGSDNDQKAFTFSVGTAKTDGSDTLDIPYGSDDTTLTIAKPFLAVDISLNHAEATPTTPTVVAAGQQIEGTLTWLNSLTSTITNGQITLKLSGDALDPSGIQTSSGYYDSSTQTITFNGQTSRSLSQLLAGQSDSGAFNLSVKPTSALTGVRNPTIQIAASVSGSHDGESSPDMISNTLVNTIKVASDLELSSRLVYSTGPFKNSGPWPPQTNQTTTYTVLLSVTNTVNDVAGATVTAILPTYVTYTGRVSPDDGSVSYDVSTRTVTWKIGAVPAGTGFGSAPLSAAFQIAFTPSSTQVNTSPALVGNQTITGTDRFTNTSVGMTAQALTTDTTTDPSFQSQFGEVTN